MSKLYTFLKYFFITFWTVFVVAPFLWAVSTSFKDFQSVNSKVTYIPWLDFEPTLEGWRVLIKSPAKGGVDIVEPYFNSIFVTCTASLISIVLGTLAAYALSRFTFKALLLLMHYQDLPLKPDLLETTILLFSSFHKESCLQLYYQFLSLFF